MSDVKTWFVTGASTGFGRAITEHLLETGHRVVATLRRPEALSDLAARYPPARLLVVRLDVTRKADVAAAFAEAQEAFGRIDVVFNNAGVATAGEVESSDEQRGRDVFDVNFWAAAHVSGQAVRFFREVNEPAGGWLLQVSSRLGLTGVPASGFYCASKFALEGLSESLAAELDPKWNIKVTLLEPGPFRTELIDKNYQSAPQHPAYADPALPGSQGRKYLTSAESFDGDVAKAAIVIERLTHLENPPIRFPLHRKTVRTMRDKAKELLEIADTYESWTQDLYHDE